MIAIVKILAYLIGDYSRIKLSENVNTVNHQILAHLIGQLIGMLENLAF